MTFAGPQTTAKSLTDFVSRIYYQVKVRQRQVNATFAEALRAPANDADLLVAPLIRARSAREQADATGASRPAPRAGPDRRAADPRRYPSKTMKRRRTLISAVF